MVVRRGLGVEAAIRHHPPPRCPSREPGRARRPRLLVRGRRLCPRPRGATADGDGVGEGGDLGSAQRGRGSLGMDREPLHGLPGLPRTPLSGVFGGVLRRPLPGAAWRLVRHPPPRRLPPIPQLGPPRAPAAVRRSQDRAMNSALGDIEIVSRLGADERTLAFDAMDGLTRPFKEIPPKHFYDTEGSRLFEQIMGLPEYYPTRTERSILQANAAALVERTRAAELVELGSGVPTKTLLLLDAMRDAGTLDRYVPFDVSEVVLCESAKLLVERYPGIRVYGVVADFERHLDALPQPEGPRVIVFLGGTIGNFLPGTRRRFLRSLRRQLRPEDRILLGTDLVKDPAVLEAAYNDSAGVTAAFNRNVLAVMNRELGADFDLDAFEHVAFFDHHQEWVEMRLRATTPQEVRIEALDLTVHFAHREEVRTEISAKFTRERLRSDLRAAGLKLEELYTDPDDLFAVTLATR